LLLGGKLMSAAKSDEFESASHSKPHFGLATGTSPGPERSLTNRIVELFCIREEIMRRLSFLGRSVDRSETTTAKKTFSGRASFYSYSTGKPASGASFDRNMPTAAHRSLPFGTRVRVTDVATSKSVIVRITDRGPNIRGRVLDLSLGAARVLGITDRGVVEVRAEVL
jgi:rare lipoprotein A (peptidoglycan hydrolase)